MQWLSSEVDQFRWNCPCLDIFKYGTSECTNQSLVLLNKSCIIEEKHHWQMTQMFPESIHSSSHNSLRRTHSTHTHTHPSPHILLTAVTGASKCYSQTLLLHRQKSDSKSAYIFIHQCTVCFGVHIYLPTSVLFFSYKLWWNSHNFVKIILSLLLFASYK